MKPTFITDEASQEPAAVTRLCRRFGIESVELRSVEDRPVWSADADRLDRLVTRTGATVAGGCALFRLYHVDDAKALQTQLAKHHIWSRIFPYSRHWLRLGLPARDQWHRLEAAL